MEDRHGLKVIATPDGDLMKFFRRKRLLSSALWNPYAGRFAKNALKLKNLGIPTVEVTGIWRVSSLKRDMVGYRRLEGECLRDLDKSPVLIERLAGFISALHQKGVFFRSVHFGNILVMPDGRMALIDIVDITFKGRPLTSCERLRNFNHLMKYNVDREAVERFGFKRFIVCYQQGVEEADLRGEGFERDLTKRLEQLAG